MKMTSTVLTIVVVPSLTIAFLETVYSVSAGMYSRELLIAATAMTFLVSAITILVVFGILRTKYFSDASPSTIVQIAVTFGASLASAFVLYEFFQSSADLHPIVLRVLSAIIVVLLAVSGWLIAGSVMSDHRPGRYLADFVPALPLLIGLLAVTLWLIAVEALPGAFVVSGAAAIAVIVVWAVYHDSTGKLTSGIVLATAMGVVGSGGIIMLWDGASTGYASRDSEQSHDVKHVILLTVDTLRWDAISLDDTTRPGATPNIAALADDSVVFTQARSPAPWTIPAFASTMSGLSPTVHQATKYGTRLDENFTTLAERMQSAGYRTAAIGSNPVLSPVTGLAQGFDSYNFFPKYPGWNSVGARLLRTLAPRRFQAEVSTDEITDLGIDWLQSNRDADSFLWLHYFDPHLPYEPPAKYRADWPSIGRFGDRFGFEKVWQFRKGEIVLSKEQRAWAHDLYQAEVSYVDDNIGRLIAFLHELGIYEETLIVLTSDHGEEFWEHGSFEHGHSVYDEVLRVPLMFKLPHSGNTSRIADPVLTQAMYSTMLQICNVSYEDAGAHSGPLVAAWENPEAFEPEILLSTGVVHYEDRVAIVWDHYKYIRGLVLGEEQLFDIRSDPEERDSIALDNDARMGMARTLLQEQSEISEWARSHYQASAAKPDSLERETLEALKAVGYVDE